MPAPGSGAPGPHRHARLLLARVPRAGCRLRPVDGPPLHWSQDQYTGAVAAVPGISSGRLPPAAVLAEQLAGAAARLWTGEEIALGEVTAELVQLGELARGLDPLGDHGQAQGPAEPDHGRDHGVVVGIQVQPG